MGKKSFDSPGWQESWLRKHQNWVIGHQESCGTGTVPDFVLVAGGVCGPWAELCSGQVSCSTSASSWLLQGRASITIPVGNATATTFGSVWKPQIKGMWRQQHCSQCSSLWPALSFLSLQTASPWEKCHFVAVLVADPSGWFPRLWGFNVLV